MLAQPLTDGCPRAESLVRPFSPVGVWLIRLSTTAERGDGRRAAGQALQSQPSCHYGLSRRDGVAPLEQHPDFLFPFHGNLSAARFTTPRVDPPAQGTEVQLGMYSTYSTVHTVGTYVHQPPTRATGRWGATSVENGGCAPTSATAGQQSKPAIN